MLAILTIYNKGKFPSTVGSQGFKLNYSCFSVLAGFKAEALSA